MNNNELISIAMCTFNGAPFLQEQLNSISVQTHLPTEIVIFDDGSDDGTIEVIQNFMKNSPFQVIFHMNEKNIGTTKNFENAIGCCTGDIIVLADQDDVWDKKKISRIKQTFLEHPEILCAFSNADVTDSTLHPLGYDLWNVVGFTANEREKIKTGSSFSVLLRHNVVTGATMAFRSSLRDTILPIPIELVHDEWIALVASALGKLVAIDLPLVKYRQHASNQIGAIKKTFLNKANAIDKRNIDREILKLIKLKIRLQNSNFTNNNQLVLEKIKRKILHLTVRVDLRENLCKGFFPGLFELLLMRYSYFSNGIKSFLADFFYRRTR